MSQPVLRTWSGSAALALLVLSTFIAGCPKKTEPAAPELTAEAPYLPILSVPPKDLPSRSASLEQIAQFAWQEFLALNWKASVDATNPPSATNPRGMPDLNWNYSMPAPQSPNPLVWQTYAQTTELRPNGPLTTPWANLGIPVYSYYTPPVQGNGVNNLWNNLDEDNEIGSCDIYANYNAQPEPKELVLFQVRVNKDEYEYLRTNYGPDQNCAPAGTSGAMNYPNCNQSAGGLLAQAQAAVIVNIQKPGYLYFPAQATTCDCPPEQAICLPCGNAAPGGPEGAIEVKSAWRRLLPSEDASRFFTTTSVYYDLNESGQLAYYNDTFALVGMHIIHKTRNFPDFIFATFEQVDVENSDAQFVPLAPTFPPPAVAPPNPPPPGSEVPPAVVITRQTGQTNRQQLHPVPSVLDDVTEKVRAQLVALNPSTVWQYYRLTGVQGASIDCPVTFPTQTPPVTASTANCVQYQDSTQCTQLNPNYYMANFMVESDPFLNNFSGPGFGAGGNAIFPGDCQNTVYNSQLYNNGGCKGCHGVAQTAFGTDFSFLLDFGNNKPSIVPATVHYNAPVTQVKQASLKKYLHATATP